MKKEIIRLASILFGICFVVTLILALANYVTQPRINTIKTENTIQIQKKVLSDADIFEPFQNNENVFIGKRSNSFVGLCINVNPTGYSDTIEMIVGIDKNGTVTGVDILSFSETPGLGSNAKEPAFLDQFKGQVGNIKVVKGGAKHGEIDAITAATVTSSAVTQGVNDALVIYADVMKGDEFNVK